MPKKRMVCDLLCLMKKRKGWSALKVIVGALDLIVKIAVAAAASVPSSLTSTKAL